ncbi:hypothetical protein FXO38_12177 [Capsicum annuum]|nr:hypothetical protein FXO38_12177 [Capsicum annuum]
MLYPAHYACGTYISQYIVGIFDKADQVLKGPIFSDVEYVEPPASPGRGGRGRGRGHGREHKHRGIVPMQRGGRGQGYLSVQPKPQIHLIVDPEPHPAAKVEHISDIGTTQILPFDPSSYMPACSSMPQPHHFSTYIAPSLVDEEVRQSYDNMHYRDVATPLRLSFGSTEFGDISILYLSLCSISKYPSELVAPCTSQPTTDDPVDTQVLEAAHSVIPDASHAPTDVTKETQDPVYKNKRKKKQCADPIAAITRKYHNDGDDDAHGGLRPYTSIRFRACGTQLFSIIHLKCEFYKKIRRITHFFSEFYSFF